MTTRPHRPLLQKTRQQQLFQAIQEYLQNTGLIQNSTKNPEVYKLELQVRSLNLQRLP